MNELLEIFEKDWAAIKAFLASSETWLIALIKAEWNLDRQLAIQDLTADLKIFGTTLQSQNGGISAKSLSTAFLGAIEGQFAVQAGTMLWQDVLLAVSLATASLNPAQVTGNGGTLTGGNSGPVSS